MTSQTIEVLTQILLGGLLGIVGQGLRIVVGLKKLNDKAQTNKVSVTSLIETNQLLTSLLISFCAGALALTSISTFKPDFLNNNAKQNILAIIAAGYSGTDFIEGFIKKHL